ncbi:MAG: SagB/ThcOx family dehydrogenase [Caldisericia bacterium]|nr:SagB/ThcOx family dehydrogenase [Caldisericia bacterium]
MEKINLPEPKDYPFSLVKSIKERKSIRDYKDYPLNIDEISILLYSASKIPSAGALYPLRFYLFSRNVMGIPFGFYVYNSNEHSLVKIFEDDITQNLYKACLNQSSIKKSSAIIVITSITKITTKRYGERGIRYVYMEAGHSSQNIYLVSTSLNIGTVAIGAFIDDEVKKILRLKEDESPLYLMPLGKI